MNTPEGWPTREMVNVGLATFMNTRKGVDAKDAMAQIFTDMYAAAPTPPALEDEPVWVKQRWQRSHGDDVLVEEVVKHMPEKFSGCRYILVNRRADDKLRQAAEEVVRSFDNYMQQESRLVELIASIENLRAALERK